MVKYIKNLSFYAVIIGAFSAIIYWIIEKGSLLENSAEMILNTSGKTKWEEFLITISNNLHHPLAILLAQIVTIIFAVRLFSWICKKIGQPTVVGEIIAGIVLGPSLIGMYFPEFNALLFPEHSLGNLQFLSQIGLILFMFIVGMEIDIKLLKSKANEALVISNTSIIFPFALGLGLAYFLYESFAPTGIRFSSFGLFIGIAMSITAFPVLARIVQERGLHKAKIGTIIITSAAVDDISAWSLLAAVIALVNAGSFQSSLFIILLAAIYVVVMIMLVRPFLKRVGDLHSSRENLSKPVVAIFILTLILSSWATEVIGIHALFGAFMAGAIMPDNARFKNIFIEKIEDIALVLLLPLFFVYTGLRTEIGLLNEPRLWLITGVIILVAITGKFLGSAIAAKVVGQSWKDSLTIGALMNTRGLVELVVLNIGYDLGVLSPEIFAMLVIMALFTTFLTGPSLDLIDYLFKSKTAHSKSETEIIQLGKYKILISFAKPESGKLLTILANSLVRNTKASSSITAMHLISSNSTHHYNLNEYEEQSFIPITEASSMLDQKIQAVFKVSADIEGDIVDFANKGHFDLLLIGIGQSIFEGTLLGKLLGFPTKVINPERILGQVTGKQKNVDDSIFDQRTQNMINRCETTLGVFVDKGFKKAEKVMIPLIQNLDIELIDFAQKLIKNSNSQIHFVDFYNQINKDSTLKESLRAIEQITPNHLQIIKEEKITKEFLAQQDLMLVSVEGWSTMVEMKKEWLTEIPSTLFISIK